MDETGHKTDTKWSTSEGGRRAMGRPQKNEREETDKYLNNGEYMMMEMISMCTLYENIQWL